jgi:hypothetical protein
MDKQINIEEEEAFVVWLSSQREEAWVGIRRIWADARGAWPDLPLPCARFTEEGCACLSWSQVSLYVECELDSEGNVYWYAYDRKSKKSEDGDQLIGLNPWFEKLI